MSKLMTSEEIVRAVAAVEQPYTYDDYGVPTCGLCERDVSRHDEDGGYHLDDHRPDCPWQLAVEWVAEREALHTFDLAPGSSVPSQTP